MLEEGQERGGGGEMSSVGKVRFVYKTMFYAVPAMPSTCVKLMSP